jgi:hypothetical protein
MFSFFPTCSADMLLAFIEVSLPTHHSSATAHARLTRITKDQLPPTVRNVAKEDVWQPLVGQAWHARTRADSSTSFLKKTGLNAETTQQCGIVHFPELHRLFGSIFLGRCLK